MESPRPLRWEALTKKDFDAIDRSRAVVLLTCSPLEVHGPHLPLGADALEDEDDVEELGWPGGEPASKVPPGYPMPMGALAIGPCLQCPVASDPCQWAAAGVALLWGPAEAAPGGGSLGGAGMPGGLCVCCKWGIIAGMPGGRTGPL